MFKVSATEIPTSGLSDLILQSTGINHTILWKGNNNLKKKHSLTGWKVLHITDININSLQIVKKNKTLFEQVNLSVDFKIES